MPDVARRELRFIRQKCMWSCSDYYETITDVWVFGDVAGYRYFQDCLRTAGKAKNNLHVQVAPKSNSMRVLVVPPADRPAKTPRLRMVERIVLAEREPEMELVIYGNAAGYEFLADCFECELESGVDNPYSHTHVDQNCPQLVQRSISLNIRGPLLRWNKKALRDWANVALTRQQTYLPVEATRYANPGEIFEYEEIEPRSYPALRQGRFDMASERISIGPIPPR